MTVLIPSLNTAVERLIAVERNVPGQVHRKTLDESLPGGKPVNVARMLTQLGGDIASPWLAGYLGGSAGDLIRSGLAREQLAGTWVDVDGVSRFCEVLVDLSDPGGATVYNGVGTKVSAIEVSELDSIVMSKLSECRALVCTGSIAPGVAPSQYARWVTESRRRGLISLVDTTGAALLAAAQSGPTIVKLNRDELRAAGGADLVDSWRAVGVAAVIVTDGPKSVLALTPGGDYEIVPPTVEVVNAIGSGDAFTAGLVHSLLNQPADWPAHLRAAAACGASNAQNLYAALRDPSELEQLRAQTNLVALSTTDTMRALRA